ncbi:hypothetical protein KI387_043521, partial [Taxus chinensis]
MASWIASRIQHVWPFASIKNDDLKVSNGRVGALVVPETTKQFVFALHDPDSSFVVYLLATEPLSERSASDAECLVRAIRPKVVVAQIHPSSLDDVWAEESNLSAGKACFVPTSLLGVLKCCFLENINWSKYESRAGSQVLQIIFGTGFYGHVLAAKQAAIEIHSPFFFLETPYKNSQDGKLDATKNAWTDVEQGKVVDCQLLSQVNKFRIAVEGLIIALNSATRIPIKKEEKNMKDVNFDDLPYEEKCYVLFAQALRRQARQSDTVVAIIDASSLSRIRKHWTTRVLEEISKLAEECFISDTSDNDTNGDASDNKRKVATISTPETPISWQSAFFGQLSPPISWLGFHRFRGEDAEDTDTLVPFLERVESPIPKLKLHRINSSFPTFSPDGSLITFNPNSGLLDGGVHLVKTDGSKKWKTNFKGPAFAVAWNQRIYGKRQFHG